MKPRPNGFLAEDKIDQEGEIFDYLDQGVSITLTVVEMSPEEYAKLPEFAGW